MRLAVVGAGWAGLAAAVSATRAGHRVTLHEASRQIGGRARTLSLRLPDGSTANVDNGQHIFIGAYREVLALMRLAGVEPREVLHRMPLTLRFPDGRGLALPSWPTPLDAAWGIASARGWSIRDKVSLVRHALGWQLRRFRCADTCSVAQLCEGLSPRVLHDLVEPLCVAALNIPAHRASAGVFLRVLQDGLFGPPSGGWGASNLLIPKVDLARVLPDAAVRWLEAHGARVRTAARVRALQRQGEGWLVDGEGFDAVVLACPPWDAERLVAGSGVPAPDWLRDAGGLAHEAIATVYATGGPRLPLPMLALHHGPDAPAQFVFDRGQLGGPAGLLGFVISASQGDAATIERQVVTQAHALGWPVQPVRTVVEKRATFACTPGLRRPATRIGPGLLACGDYVDGPYPATLEGAVRSAQSAVAALP
ncbi:MAG TPA: hydroxysqualene dehydroxylase HpnE [Ramlibacter sp.]|nr:hydroxysqualene dehydroxylase HpnE [Ramlibacter sp.]